MTKRRAGKAKGGAREDKGMCLGRQKSVGHAKRLEKKFFMTS